jgi:predicted transcriptional regulator
MSVGQYCDREIGLVSQGSSILEAAQIMRNCHVGEVVVVKQHNGKNIPVGIITDRDLVIEIIAMEVNVDQISVGSIMSLEMITVNEDKSLRDTLEVMQLNGIRRSPVVDKSGALLGLIKIEDILEVLSHDMAKVLELFHTERRIETTLRT